MSLSVVALRFWRLATRAASDNRSITKAPDASCSANYYSLSAPLLNSNGSFFYLSIDENGNG